MSESLLKTKLFAPPRRSSQVSRVSLLDKLNHALQMHIPVLVSAPAGFGKTTLVSDWVRSSGFAFAWLALDDGDNDLLRFWRYVDAALQAIDLRIGESLRPALYSTQAPVIEQIITGLVNDILSVEKDFIFVLEDYHVIEQPKIHESLNFLLDHLPPQMQLVITTRSDPSLNLARRRGRGQLVEIRATDLRFSPSEAGVFLNQSMLLDLSEADITALSQRTEGWITGLQMVALSLQDETDRHAFVSAFSGDDRHIADYLMEEVLLHQPVEFQDFLQQTSILDRLNASLCDAVTGRIDSRALLSLLDRTNLFVVPLDNHREWYRYHHLFADLLHKRLRETHSADEIAALHRAASAWYELKGDIPTAVEHALQACDDRRILALLEAHYYSFYSSNNLPQLFDLACLLPADLRPTSPALCSAVAWAGLATNRHPDVDGWLTAIETYYGLPAETALDDARLDASVRAALLEVLVIRLQGAPRRSLAEQRTHVLAIREQLNALPSGLQCLMNVVESLKPVTAFNLGLLAQISGEIALASEALEECIALAREQHNSTLFHLAVGQFALLQLAQGHLHAARQTHEQSLAEARRLGQTTSPMVAISHVGLGWLHYEWNDLAQAEHHFNEGLAQARLWNHWDSLLSVALGRARLKVRAGDVQAALSILEDVGLPPPGGVTLPLEAFAALLRARYSDPDPVSAWLSSQIMESALEPNPISEGWVLEIAYVLAALERREEARALVQKIIQFAQSSGRTHTLIRAKTALALVDHQPQALVDALELAEPEGYFSSFIDEGKPMQNLLNHLSNQPHLSPKLSVYVGKLLSGFEAAPPKPRQSEGMIEPLSEREVEVLFYMSKGLSNPEIARRLYLSPNTLKAHTQNIFMKLDVHNRLEAVSKARELGLIT